MFWWSVNFFQGDWIRDHRAFKFAFHAHEKTLITGYLRALFHLMGSSYLNLMCLPLKQIWFLGVSTFNDSNIAIPVSKQSQREICFSGEGGRILIKQWYLQRISGRNEQISCKRQQTACLAGSTPYSRASC